MFVGGKSDQRQVLFIPSLKLCNKYVHEQKRDENTHKISADYE